MCEDSNPFCLAEKPTDPYNWIYFSGTWYYAKDFVQNEPNSGPNVYKITNSLGTNYFYCAQSCTGIPGTSGSTYIPIANANSIYTYGATCQAPTLIRNDSAAQLTNYSPVPNSRTGSCERTSLNDPCANPCIRLDNGKLAINSNSGSCRVFPNVTSGGNAAFLNNTCPTVCPSACVELWETCPPGTGPLTTLAQTKTATDVMSLTGPYRLDGAPNPLWPTNYTSSRLSKDAIMGKPYTECYAYNTQFCDLPMAWQKTVVLPVAPYFDTLCYSSCPAGTYPDKTDPANCLFLPDDTSSTAVVGPDTPVRTVFCNPQYFNPLYWDAPNGGIQKGCTSRPLPSKQGSSCLQGTSPLVNEFFNLEWCVPDCPVGYFFDLTQSTCVASCQGTDATTNYNSYLDFVDFYATTNRCIDGLDCVQNATPGRCPSKSSAPVNSRVVLNSQLNSSDAPAPEPAECPLGMAPGVEARNESANLCYDICQAGYEPVSFCSNGQPTCSNENRIFSCRALCPSHREGLGPWTANNNNPIFTCSYNYPGNVVPADPNLWAQCPDDGRYTLLSSTSVNDTSLSALTRKEPLCIRKSYLRRSTCPIGFTEIGSDCFKACNANDALITASDGTMTCQSSTTQSSRFELDLSALTDGNAKSEFKNRILIRKAFSRGLGSDPNSGLGDTSEQTYWQTFATGAGALALIWLVLQILKLIGF